MLAQHLLVSCTLQVQVSMKFNGQSSVEVHPPSNLEELMSMTSISLFMRVDPDKDPIEDRFILYLGDRNVRNLEENKKRLLWVKGKMLKRYNWRPFPEIKALVCL